MVEKLRRCHWGWGMRVDKDGVAHDSFVAHRHDKGAVKTKWRVKPRGSRKAKPVPAR